VAVWQIAAIITAQKFLADIDKRLANIERGLSNILSYLEDRDQAKLKAWSQRLCEMAHAAREQQFNTAETAALAHQLESIDREAQELTELYLRNRPG